MEVKEIIGMIALSLTLVLIVGTLCFVLIYTAKQEKEHKELSNKELNARIQFYKDFINYVNK